MTRPAATNRDLARFFDWVIAAAFGVAFLVGFAVGVWV